MSKLSILDDARNDWKAARRERDLSVPVLLCMFFLLDIFGQGEMVSYFWAASATMIVYCLMSIRLAVYATGLRNLMAMIDEKEEQAKEETRLFLMERGL